MLNRNLCNYFGRMGVERSFQADHPDQYVFHLSYGVICWTTNRIWRDGGWKEAPTVSTTGVIWSPYAENFTREKALENPWSGNECYYSPPYRPRRGDYNLPNAQGDMVRWLLHYNLASYFNYGGVMVELGWQHWKPTMPALLRVWQGSPVRVHLGPGDRVFVRERVVRAEDGPGISWLVDGLREGTLLREEVHDWLQDKGYDR